MSKNPVPHGVQLAANTQAKHAIDGMKKLTESGLARQFALGAQQLKVLKQIQVTIVLGYRVVANTYINSRPTSFPCGGISMSRKIRSRRSVESRAWSSCALRS